MLDEADSRHLGRYDPNDEVLLPSSGRVPGGQENSIRQDAFHESCRARPWNLSSYVLCH